MSDSDPNQRRTIRLDHPHATAQLIDAVRANEPDYEVIEKCLEQHPELHSSVISRANQLRMGTYRRPIHQLRHAAVFLGLSRLRSLLAHQLRIDPRELLPPSADADDLDTFAPPVKPRVADQLPFL